MAVWFNTSWLNIHLVAKEPSVDLNQTVRISMCAFEIDMSQRERERERERERASELLGRSDERT